MEYSGKSLEEILSDIKFLSTEVLPKEYERIKEKNDSIAKRYEEIKFLEEEIDRLQIINEYHELSVENKKKIDNALDILYTKLFKKKRRFYNLSGIKIRGGNEIEIKYKIIADILNVPVGTVTSALSRLKEKFRDIKSEIE